MPSLVQVFYLQEWEYLRLVAELWELETLPAEAEAAAETLSASLLDGERLAAKMALLPTEAKEALRALLAANGRLPWVTFTRRFGELRSMGAARREREQPHRHPASVAEVLYYHGLLARAFFDTPDGPQEFAYLPDDLLPLLRSLLPQEASPASARLGRAARPAERAHLRPFSDALLDDLTTLLAALRLGRDLDAEEWRYPLPFMQALLESAGLTRAGEVQGEAVRAFLEMSRLEALCLLQRAWLESRSLNELRLLPHLLFEGEWQNPAWETRQRLLGWLAALPPGQWWHLDSFIQGVKEHFPDFQRPAGDYDSWFIRRREDGRFLRGFDAWDEVEGALLRFLLVAVLPALGLVELAAPAAGEEVSAFRWHTAWALRPGEKGYMIEPLQPLPLLSEQEKLHVNSQGQLRLPPGVPRKVRYLLARLAEWEPRRGDEYRYRITAKSLRRASQQGLKGEHLLGLLRAHAAELPPSLLKALERWQRQGEEMRLEEHLLLRLRDPQTAEALRHSPAARFLGEALGPTTFIVPRHSARKLREVLLTLGWLVGEEGS